MQQRKKSFWTVLLSVLFALLLRFVIRGDLYYYLHPKMFKFIYMAIVILALLAVHEFFSSGKKALSSKGAVLFLLPVFIMALRPHAFAGGGMIQNRIYQKTPRQPSKVQFGFLGLNRKKDYADRTAEELGILSNEEFNALQHKSRDPFLVQMEQIYDVEQDEGREYTVEGFVIKDNSFKEDRFFLGRMVITCCIADAMIDGVLCEADFDTEIEPNSWVRVTGRVQRSGKKAEDRLDLADSNVVLKLTKMEEIKPPDPPYIYAY
ncbi:MAG: TIGR03943 family protein [Filifactor alocis]|nr:TIGR03943 family protein [Filifactor alocis]